MPYTIRNGKLVKVTRQVTPEIEVSVTTPEVEPVRLTPKQALQREADLMGLDFTDRTTIAELEQMIQEAADEA